MALLEMERPMDSWNDERLDELSRRMDEGFKEMREGFARLYLVLITGSIGLVASVLLTAAFG
jgi:hypothetical protein